MKVVVTGGAGFIGSHIVDELLAAGCDVVVVDALLSDAHRITPSYLNPGADYRFVDIRDESELGRVVDGTDAVLHHAAMVGLGESFADAPSYVLNNDVGTVTLLKALYARSWRGRFLLASSMVVYGEGCYSCTQHGTVRPPPRSDDDLRMGRFDPMCPVCCNTLTPEPVSENVPTDPRSVYAATKLHQEHLCQVFGRETGTPVAAFRYHNVYGPRMPTDTPYAGVASIFRSSLGKGKPALVFEDGRQLRDFIHVSDAARASIRWLECGGSATGPFNIGSGVPSSILDMAEALTRSCGKDRPSPQITGRYRLGDVRHIFASSERAAATFGWRAEVDFDVGMRKFATAPQRH